MSIALAGWLVIAFPLAGMLIVALGWGALPGRAAGWIASSAIGLAFVSAVIVLIKLLDRDPEQRTVVSNLYHYAHTAGVNVDLGIYIDPLSVFMALVVSGVSFLIHVYSVSYMTSDRGYSRYFAYLNYFVFSMLLLVLAGNFFILIVGWASVGTASYLLISYWYRRRTATRAGLKSFVVNVLGDIGLTLGTFFLFKHFGTLDFLGVFAKAGSVGTNNGDLVAGL